MPKQEMPLVVSMTNRTNSLSKDSYMANCYKEVIDNVPYLVKRPGKAFFPNSVTPLSLNTTGVGQGMWEYNGGLYAVANGTLYKIDGVLGTTTVVQTGINTTNNISWVNTFSTTSPHPYMVYHDKVNGYFLDATGKTAMIDCFNTSGTLLALNIGAGTGATSGTWTASTGTANGTFTAVAGVITSYTITSGGTGYIATPTITASTGSLGTNTLTAPLNSFPSNPVNGLVYLDGYVFAMDSGGIIWQSNAEDPSTWGALNYLTAKAEPDKGIGIAKHLNYLVAFKQWTTEFFYDNANATGSVLARNATAQLEIGCASGDSIQTLESAVIWMSTPKEGGRTVSVLAGTEAATISNSHIEKYLNASTLVGVYSWIYKLQGHTFYGLVLTDQNITLIYDMNEKEWHVWTTSKNYVGGGEGYFECTFIENFPRGSNVFFVLDAITRNVYTISPSNYHDPFGDILVKLVTRRHSFGTLKEKSNPELVILGDALNDTLQVSHTNDDYLTWSTSRNVDLSLQKPVIYRNGKFKRRAWSFSYSGTNPLRLQAVMFTLTGQFEE